MASWAWGGTRLSLPSQLLSRGSFGASDAFSLCFAAPDPSLLRLRRSLPARGQSLSRLPGEGGLNKVAGKGPQSRVARVRALGRLAGTGPQGRRARAGAPRRRGVASSSWGRWRRSRAQCGSRPSAGTSLLRGPLGGHAPGPRALQVPQAVWSSGPYGGAMLDSGTTFTYLPSPAFREFSRVLQQHVRHLALVPGPDPRFKDICYLASHLAEDRGQAREHGAEGRVAPLPETLAQGASGSSPGRAPLVEGPCAGEAHAGVGRQQQGQEWRQSLARIFPAALVLGDGQEVVLEPFNYLFQHKGRRGAYCLGVFENPDRGVLLGGSWCAA